MTCVELDTHKRKCQKTLQVIGRWFAYQLQKMPRSKSPMPVSICSHSSDSNTRVEGIQQMSSDAQLLEGTCTSVAILPGSSFGRAPEEIQGDLELYLGYLIESMVST
ncbi:Aspartate aminotransferase [Phytophthora megakarya]|uniref:Aspartate aminotransferase n=1 Tax=Phytophthora megakarya TaxID=4795 RepID=A0A225X0S2_9STRA|nr:Aspartate aminotransferase [Phytophthora megakarya]